MWTRLETVGEPEEEKVEDAAEGIDIRLWSDPATISSGLLGGHVGWCAKDLPRDGHAFFPGMLGETEIGNAGAGHPDRPGCSSGLKIAMNDASLVGLVNRVEHGHQQGQRFLGGTWGPVFAHQGCQVVALDQRQ